MLGLSWPVMVQHVWALPLVAWGFACGNWTVTATAMLDARDSVDDPDVDPTD